jgi:hypothetical protein
MPKERGRIAGVRGQIEAIPMEEAARERAEMATAERARGAELQAAQFSAFDQALGLPAGATEQAYRANPKVFGAFLTQAAGIQQRKTAAAERMAFDKEKLTEELERSKADRTLKETIAQEGRTLQKTLAKDREVHETAMEKLRQEGRMTREQTAVMTAVRSNLDRVERLSGEIAGLLSGVFTKEDRRAAKKAGQTEEEYIASKASLLRDEIRALQEDSNTQLEAAGLPTIPVEGAEPEAAPQEGGGQDLNNETEYNDVVTVLTQYKDDPRMTPYRRAQLEKKKRELEEQLGL